MKLGGPTFLENQRILERLRFLQDLHVERFGHRAVQVIANVFYGSFFLAVLILTVIAITYKPPGASWLQQERSYEHLFNSVGNSTFQPDDSILITGDDLNVRSPSSILLLPPINATAVDAEVQSLELNSCNTSNPWTCSDPGVKIAVEKMNLFHFAELDIYKYRIIAKGGSNGECDVAWSYRPKNMTTPRMYGDYRRYYLTRDDECGFKVKKIGGWHSGVNVRPSDGAQDGDEELGDAVHDSVAVAGNEPDIAFRQTKYLYYTRGADYCKSMNQFMWSFLCALGEAKYLNRTFVMDLDICLSAENNLGHEDEPGKDFRYYFDYEHLETVTSIVEKNSFEDERSKWDGLHPTNLFSEIHVMDHKIKPADVKNDTHDILYRDFISEVDSDNYWYRVCEGDAEKYIQRPWDFVWKSKRLMNIVNAICNKLEWDFDVVHVVRGYKAANKELWPNLDRDTSPENLIAKLKTMIGYRRKLYIATNEPYSHYFDRLRELFEIHMLDDFSHLWAENSEWYNETLSLSNHPVSFDGYMRLIVDTEMLYRGKKRVQTFYDLTKDCKDGVNRC